MRPDGTQATHVVKRRTALPEVSPNGKYVSYIADGRTPNTNIRIARLSDGADMDFSIPIRNVRRTSVVSSRRNDQPLTQTTCRRVCTTSTRSDCALITASIGLYAAGVSSMTSRSLRHSTPWVAFT